MRKPGLALLLCTALLAPGAAPAQVQTPGRELIIRGSGATITCAGVLELRAASTGVFAIQKREQYHAVVAWGLGYLSGAARYGKDLDPLRTMDEDATLAWLLEYCQARQATEFRRALEAFIDAHPPR